MTEADFTRSETLRVVVWSKEGLFTQPAFRSDRTTYAVCPPTAAQGIIGGIYIHPCADIHNGERSKLRIDIKSIKVLSPIQYMNQRVTELQDLPSAWRPMNVEHRLSNLVLLREPKYLFEFSYVALFPSERRSQREMVTMAADIFKRRVRNGQSFANPLGMGRRRYAAHFREPTEEDRPQPIFEILGTYPWGFEYNADGGQKLHTFTAQIRNGVMHVESFWEYLYELRGEW